MGSGTDLGIAIAILAASQQIPESAIKKPFSMLNSAWMARSLAVLNLQQFSLKFIN